MSQLSDLKMSVDATFSSILNEVTPYAAYITLKKSTLKDQDGSLAFPSPPVLSLLQEAQHVIGTQKAEIQELKEFCAASTEKLDNIVIENSSLLDEIDESKKALEASST